MPALSTRAPSAVLVTDGEERAALAAVRSLGRAGYRVYACAGRDHSLAAASRYCQATATTPSPLVDARGYLEAVASLLERWKIDVLLPVSEQALRVLLPARFQDHGVRIPFPSHDVFALVSDKEELPWNSKISVDINYRASTATLTAPDLGTGILDIL